MPVALFHAEHGNADAALQSLRKVKERQTDASVAMATLPIIFGADLTKATIRSFAKEACARLLKSPLIEQLEPSEQAQVRVCDALVALSNRDYAGAARKFVAISAAELPSDGVPGVVLPREVGLYGTICALAALERLAHRVDTSNEALASLDGATVAGSKPTEAVNVFVTETIKIASPKR